MRRILGVDFGDARTGLAVSDTLGMMANGIGFIYSTNLKKTAQLVVEKAIELDVAFIIVGNPVNMNGTLGPRAQKSQEFVDLLQEKLSIPIKLFDERCTTMVAHQILNETNIKGRKRKGVIDTLSAEILLQNYMDSVKTEKRNDYENEL